MDCTGWPMSKQTSTQASSKLVLLCRVCLLSALNFHNRMTQDSFEVWMVIARGTHCPRAEPRSLRIHYFSGPALIEGVEEHRIVGGAVPSVRKAP